MDGRDRTARTRPPQTRPPQTRVGVPRWIAAFVAGALLVGAASGQQAPTDAVRRLVESTLEAIRGSDEDALEALYDPETRLADVDPLGLAERPWSDLDDISRRGHILATVDEWASDDPRFHREAITSDLEVLEDPNAGLGVLDDRRVVRARLRNLRTDEERDVIVVATPDGRLLDVQFGAIGAARRLEPEAWSVEEPRSPIWPEDVDIWERDVLAELVDEFEAATDVREQAELVEEIHRDPYLTIPAVLERLIELDRLDPAPSATKDKLFASIERVTGRGAPGGVSDGGHAELVAWLRWQRRHGRDFEPAPIVDPIEPTAAERMAGVVDDDDDDDEIALDGWAHALERRRDGRAEEPSADEPPADAPTAASDGNDTVADTADDPPAPAPWRPPEREVTGLDTPAPTDALAPRADLTDAAARLEVRRGNRTHTARDLEQQLTRAQRVVLNDWAGFATEHGLVVAVGEQADAVVFAATSPQFADGAARTLDDTHALIDPLVPVVDGREPGATAAFLIDYDAHRADLQDRLVEALVEAGVLEGAALTAMQQDPTSLMMRGMPGFIQFTWDMAGNAAAGDDEFRAGNEVAHKYAQCLVTTRLGPTPDMLRWGLGFVVEVELFESVYMFDTTGFVSSGDHFDWHTRTRQHLEKRKTSWSPSDDILATVGAGEAQREQMIAWGCLEYLRGKRPEALREMLGALGTAQREASKWSTLFRVPDGQAAAIVDAAFEDVDKRDILSYLKATR